MGSFWADNSRFHSFSMKGAAFAAKNGIRVTWMCFGSTTYTVMENALPPTSSRDNMLKIISIRTSSSNPRMEFTSFAIHVLITSRLTFFMSTYPITLPFAFLTFSLKFAGKTVDFITFFSLSVKRKSEPADVPYK